jgi:5-formyltetrahydrofolate cyclo-ligase
MLKADIRRQFQQKRSELELRKFQAFNDKIRDLFFEFLPGSTNTIHIFLPIIPRREIDTWPIIYKLWERGKNTVAPCLDMETRTMTSWLLTPDTELRENRWNIPEPVNSTLVENNAIDMVVLPLLAFDRQGYRVGYGKGFYDRFLASFHHQALKIGISLFDPIDEISDRSYEDVPMDHCITPGQVFTF